MSIPRTNTEPLRRLQQLAEPDAHAALQSDAELLELYIANDDRQAMATLVERYAGMVASVCRLTVADAASAEDAFQATFLVLLKSARQVRKRNSVAAWLHGVAYRTASRIRARNRRISPAAMPTTPSSNECHEPEDRREQDPIHELARQMDLELLDRELGGLPESLREALIEHYLLGHSVPQIAERMELSVSAVEGRLRRGRRTLRRRLAQRGISLSVALAGAYWFQQHVHAAEAVSWSEKFRSEHVVPDHSAPTSNVSSQVSSLVKEEMNMLFKATYLRSFGPLALLVAAGTLTTLYNGLHLGVMVSQSAGGEKTTIQSIPLEASDHVLAQLGEATPANQTPSGTAAPPIDQSAPVDPFYDPRLTTGGRDPSAETTAWQKPVDEKVPAWLAGGLASSEAIETNRASLAKRLDVEFSAIPLAQVLRTLADDAQVPIALNEQELELIGVDSDVPITLSAAGSLREILRRITDPLDLAYMVTESAIEITTKDHANESPNLRFYDLSYVLPNSANAWAVISAIESTVDPDSWLNAGGTSVITLVGSTMIVSAPDTMHQKIEEVLLNIAKMNPTNVEKPQPAFPSMNHPGMMGGMGGGMF